MSYRFDSPPAQGDPRLEIGDVHLFPGTDGTVFVINVNALSGSGGFHPDGIYEFKIDTDADTIEDITFRVTFRPRDSDGRQSVDLHRLDGVAGRDRHVVGTPLAHGLTEETIDGCQGVQIWAGPAADPCCYFEGDVIRAVKRAVAEGALIDPSAWNCHEATNILASINVSSIVLEVPNELFEVGAIGFWGVTALPTDAGDWWQTSRCAEPLINIIFDPDDSEHSIAYNRAHPSEDREIH